MSSGDAVVAGVVLLAFRGRSLVESYRQEDGMVWVLGEVAVWLALIAFGAAFACSRKWAWAVACVAAALPGLTELWLGYSSLWPEVFLSSIGMAVIAWVAFHGAAGAVGFVSVVRAYLKERRGWTLNA